MTNAHITHSDTDLQELEKAVWHEDNILLKNKKGAEFEMVTYIPGKLGDEYFAVFDILVAETLNIINHSSTWCVTKKKDDGIVSIEGYREGVEFPELRMSLIPQKIIGRVTKYTDEGIFREIGFNLWDINQLKSNKEKLISIVILVISTNDKKHLQDVKNYVRGIFPQMINFCNSELWTLDGDAFAKVWAINSERVLPIIERCFKDEKEREKIDTFKEYLRRKIPFAAESISLDVAGKKDGMTGQVLHKELHIKSNIPLKFKVKCRWNKDSNENHSVEILRPFQLTGDGYDITISEHHIEDIHIRCFVTGRISLGTIELVSKDGHVLKSISLGSANFAHRFYPNYFSSKNNKLIEAEGTQSINEVIAGNVVAMAIIGVGGSGKTRLCEEIVDEAHKKGFQCLTLEHPLNKTSKQQLIKELFFEIFNYNTKKIKFIEDLVNDLTRKIETIGEDFKDNLKSFFENAEDSYNTLVVVKALFALLAIKCDSSPFILHFKDMHWGNKEEFEIFVHLINNLRRNQNRLGNGIFFIFEGRNKEALREDENYISPFDWFNFLKNDFLKVKEVKVWTAEESEEFLNNLFEENLNRNELEEFNQEKLPLYKDLIQHLLKWSNGNPMHLIEQIKLLIANEFVHLNKHNGLIFVRKKLPSDYQAPPRTLDLIRSRIAFFRSRCPELVDLLVLFSKVERKIPVDFFDYMLSNYSFKNGNPRETLKNMDFAYIPIKEFDSHFEFYHENYFQTFKYDQISDDLSLPEKALQYYRQFETPTLKQISHQVKIHFLLRNKEFNWLVNQIVLGLEISGDDYINEEFYKFLLKIPENFLVKPEHQPFNVHYQIAEILIRIGSWNEALRHLLEIKKIKPDHRYREEYEKTLLETKDELTNVFTDLQKPDNAIKEADEALKKINVMLLIKPNEDFYLKLREKLLSKKAVVMWFNGDYVNGTKWQWESYLSSKNRNDYFEIIPNDYGMGTIFLHRYPERGVKLYENALHLIETIPGVHYQEKNLLTVQYLLAKLLVLCKKPGAHTVDPLKNILNNAQIAYHNCTNKETQSYYEACISGLLIGSCLSLLKKYDEAKHYFTTTIAISTNCNLTDIIWKARLNLAQICKIEGSEIEAGIHAKEAFLLISEGLELLRGHFRTKREAMMELPLLHIYRLHTELRKRIAGYLSPGSAEIIENWDKRPSYISRAGETQQVLHVRDGANDFFMLN